MQDGEAHHEEDGAQCECQSELAGLDSNCELDGASWMREGGNVYSRIGRKRKAIEKHAMPPRQHAMNPKKLRMLELVHSWA